MILPPASFAVVFPFVPHGECNICVQGEAAARMDYYYQIKPNIGKFNIWAEIYKASFFEEYRKLK